MSAFQHCKISDNAGKFHFTNIPELDNTYTIENYVLSMSNPGTFNYWKKMQVSPKLKPVLSIINNLYRLNIDNTFRTATNWDH